MRHILLFFVSIYFIPPCAKAQPAETKFLIDTAIAIMKVHAVNRNKVDWPTIEQLVYAQAATAKNAYQLGPAFRTLFKSINDFHGAFYCWDSTYNWPKPGVEYADSIKNEWKKGVFIQTEMLEGENVGYLRVPPMSFAERPELDKKAQALNDSLCILLNKKVKGIVLDLRLNGGGAMYPMILGLQQLLHEGKVGSFSGNKVEWIIKNNSFYFDTTILNTINPKCTTSTTNIPVAVLIGQGTGSSGEFLTISFKQREHTIFIGEKTGGYVTSNRGFAINNVVSLLLATDYGKDRNGKEYTDGIEPDIYSNALDSFNNIKKDKKVLTAVKWIKNSK